MSLDPAWALQVALYEALSQDPQIRGLIGDPPRLHDAIPEDAVFPLVRIGAGRIEAYSGIAGAYQHTARIIAYSRYGGRKECKAIAHAVRGVLHDARLPMEHHRMVQARLVFEDHLRYRDPETFQATMRYRFVTVPEAVAA